MHPALQQQVENLVRQELQVCTNSQLFAPKSWDRLKTDLLEYACNTCRMSVSGAVIVMVVPVALFSHGEPSFSFIST